MRESSILHHCLLALSEAGYLACRNNTGVGWAGKTIHVSKPTTVTLMPGDVLIRQARPLRAGLGEGGGDIVGIGDGGRFCMVETKIANGRQSDAQISFGDGVIKHGGRYGVARTPDESIAIFQGQL